MRTRYSSKIVPFLAAVLCAVTLAATISAPTAGAHNTTNPHTHTSITENYKIATLNAQGAKLARNDNIWQTMVLPAMNAHGLAAMTIQEAGNQPPPSAQATGQVHNFTFLGRPAAITEYVWNVGTTSRPRNFFVYYATYHDRSHRLSMAIVTRQQATRMYHVDNADGIRPAIGVHIPELRTRLFTVHVQPPDRVRNTRTVQQAQTEARNFVGNIPDEILRQEGPGLGWMILGDWNLPSGQTDFWEWAEVVAPPCDQPTHDSGEVYDYAITRRGGHGHTPNAGELRWDRNIEGTTPTDHRIVIFNYAVTTNLTAPAQTPQNNTCDPLPGTTPGNGGLGYLLAAFEPSESGGSSVVKKYVEAIAPPTCSSTKPANTRLYFSEVQSKKGQSFDYYSYNQSRGWCGPRPVDIAANERFTCGGGWEFCVITFGNSDDFIKIR
ncbi:MAG: hypothetical protein AAGD35_08890 [Actinomycetota bacterium]